MGNRVASCTEKARPHKDATMIVKLIICDVIEAKRDQFADGQRTWSALANVSGFLGQTGGWSVDTAHKAVITAFWHDHEAYDKFMRNQHDVIFDHNAQRGTFHKSDVTIWHHICDIPGSSNAFPHVVSADGFMRIARCTVKENRTEHFESVQREVWNPGMGKAAGMLGGAFSRSATDRNNYLVCTFWRSQADHNLYRQDIFPTLRKSARVEDDCESVAGILVNIEPGWSVPTSSCA